MQTIKSILLENVPEECYFSQERVQRIQFYDKPTKVGEVGYEEKGTGKHQSCCIYHSDFPSRTLCADDYKSPLIILVPPHEGAGIVEFMGQNYSVRRTTAEEYWYLQGCSKEDYDKIKETVTKSHIYTLVGNSICPNVLRDVFKEYFDEYVSSDKPLRIFESFSGMGTQAMALKKLGVNIKNVCTSEIEPNAIIAYAMIHCGMEKDDIRLNDIDLDIAKEFILKHNICYNFKTNQVDMPYSPKKIKLIYLACQLSKNLGDIIGIDANNVPDMDLFTFSSPCTDISRAGTQEGFAEGTNTRSSLLWECEKILVTKKPKYIMMENVKDITSKKFKPYFDKWIKKLEDFGYECKWSIENAIDHDTPQVRERMILIGKLKQGA